MTNRMREFRKPKANLKQKNINIINTDSAETEPNLDKYANDPITNTIGYIPANHSRVPAEKTVQEILLNGIYKWGPGLGVLFTLIGIIFSISTHINEFNNVKNKVNDLEERSGSSKKSITKAEKKIIKLDTEVFHIKSSVSGMILDSNQIKKDLKSIEMEHVRQSIPNIDSKKITPNSSLESK